MRDGVRGVVWLLILCGCAGPVLCEELSTTGAWFDAEAETASPGVVTTPSPWVDGEASGDGGGVSTGSSSATTTTATTTTPTTTTTPVLDNCALQMYRTSIDRVVCLECDPGFVLLGGDKCDIDCGGAEVLYDEFCDTAETETSAPTVEDVDDMVEQDKMQAITRMSVESTGFADDPTEAYVPLVRKRVTTRIRDEYDIAPDTPLIVAIHDMTPGRARRSLLAMESVAWIFTFAVTWPNDIVIPTDTVVLEGAVQDGVTQAIKEQYGESADVTVTSRVLIDDGEDDDEPEDGDTDDATPVGGVLNPTTGVQQSAPRESSSSSNLAAIVGGAVGGGVLLLVGVGVVVWRVCRGSGHGTLKRNTRVSPAAQIADRRSRKARGKPKRERKAGEGGGGVAIGGFDA